MKDSIFLVVTKTRVEKLTKNLPYLKPSERAIKLDIEIEDKVFESPPITLKVNIKEKHIKTPNSDDFLITPYEWEEGN